MAGEKILGSVKRFGARYGRRVRHKVAQIEAVRFAKKKCPYCHAWKVKRVAAGIWYCAKCRNKFTGRAYTLAEQIILKEEITGPIKEEQEKTKSRNAEKIVSEEQPKDLNN